MAQSHHLPGVILLGALGKVGRSIRAVWPATAPDLPLIPLSRRPSQGLHQWQPGDPAPDTGPVRAVLALWGVTRGSPAGLAQNACLARAALELGAEVGADCVVHCSSAAVYTPGAAPLSEDAATEPPGAYGAAKLEMEQAVTAWHRAHDAPFRSVVLRIGNYAGGESLFGNMRPGGTVRLDDFGNRTGALRSYIAPTDLAHVLADMVRTPGAEGVYNVAAPLPASMEAVARAGGAAVTWTDAPETAVPCLTLDTTRLSQVIALPPATSDPAYLVANARASGIWP